VAAINDAALSVQVTHSWDAQHYAEGRRALWRFTTAGRWLRAFAYLFIAGGSLLILLLIFGLEGTPQRRLAAASPWLVVVLLWILMLRGGIPGLARLAVRQRMIDASKPLIDTISAQGYHRQQSQTEVSVPWSDLKRVVETRNLFLFFTTPSCAYFVPKDLMAQEQLEVVRELVRQHMAADCVILQSPPAAPRFS
jgi:YcxB-like protein